MHSTHKCLTRQRRRKCSQGTRVGVLSDQLCSLSFLYYHRNLPTSMILVSCLCFSHLRVTHNTLYICSFWHFEEILKMELCSLKRMSSTLLTLLCTWHYAVSYWRHARISPNLGVTLGGPSLLQSPSLLCSISSYLTSTLDWNRVFWLVP